MGHAQAAMGRHQSLPSNQVRCRWIKDDQGSKLIVEAEAMFATVDSIVRRVIRVDPIWFLSFGVSQGLWGISFSDWIQPLCSFFKFSFWCYTFPPNSISSKGDTTWFHRYSSLLAKSVPCDSVVSFSMFQSCYNVYIYTVNGWNNWTLPHTSIFTGLRSRSTSNTWKSWTWSSRSWTLLLATCWPEESHCGSPWKIDETLHESKFESMADGPFNVSYNKIQWGFSRSDMLWQSVEKIHAITPLFFKRTVRIWKKAIDLEHTTVTWGLTISMEPSSIHCLVGLSRWGKL